VPEVHNIGRLFTHKFSYPSTDFPLIDRGKTQEVTWPYRVSRPLVFRLPKLRHGFVLGWWGPRLPEDVAMDRALSGALIGYTPTRDYSREQAEEDFDVVEEEAAEGHTRRRCEACEEIVDFGPSGFCPECNELG
jgi:hypothetical protein